METRYFIPFAAIALGLLGVFLFIMPVKSQTPVPTEAIVVSNFLACDTEDEVHAFIAMGEAEQTVQEAQIAVPGCAMIPFPVQLTVEAHAVHETKKAMYDVVKITIAGSGMTQFSVYNRTLKKTEDA